MIERLNVSTGDVVQVVRTVCKLRGECESKTLGFVCTVTVCHPNGDVPVWEYEGARKKQCAECGGLFTLLPDANLAPLPGNVQHENTADPVSRREPEKPSFRAIPNAR